MASEIYTVQEMRDMAENITRVDVMDGLTCREHCYPVKQEVKSMLRHAADAVEENAKLKARLETVVNRIDKQICHPSESNCKRCGDHRGNCQCGSISNNEMMKLLNLAKGE